jgi:hypothetical protein
MIGSDKAELGCHVLEQSNWTLLNLPAIAEDESIILLGEHRHHLRSVGDLLHPERENQEALDELKASMGSPRPTLISANTPRPRRDSVAGVSISWSIFLATPPCGAF